MDVSDIFQTILGRTGNSVTIDNSVTIFNGPKINTIAGVKTNVAIMSKAECFLTPPDTSWKYASADILSDRPVKKGHEDLNPVVKGEVGGAVEDNSFVSSFCPLLSRLFDQPKIAHFSF